LIYQKWKEVNKLFDNGKRFKLYKEYQGGNGIFWKVWDTIEESAKGIKVIKQIPLSISDLTKYARESAISLLIPEHPNLNKFYSSKIVGNNIINIVEVIPGKTLFNYFETQQIALHLEKIYSFILQIVKALIDLNSYFKNFEEMFYYMKSFYHGDLHSKNIIITEEERVVLIDWGQAYRMENRKVIYPSVSPEFHPKSDYKEYRGSAIDVFSLGVMIWNLFEKNIPYGTGGYLDSYPIDISLIKEEKINDSKVLTKIDEKLYLIVINMLKYNPYERITFEEVEKFFQGTYQKIQVNKNENPFLYFKRRHIIRNKNEVKDSADSLFNVSKIISGSVNFKIDEIKDSLVNSPNLNNYLFYYSKHNFPKTIQIPLNKQKLVLKLNGIIKDPDLCDKLGKNKLSKEITDWVKGRDKLRKDNPSLFNLLFLEKIFPDEIFQRITLKAKIFEFCVKLIKVNMNLFNEEEISALAKEHKQYLDESNLWRIVSERIISYRDFEEIDKTKWRSITETNDSLIIYYLNKKNLNSTWEEYEKNLIHYQYYVNLITTIAERILLNWNLFDELTKLFIFLFSKFSDKGSFFKFFYDIYDKLSHNLGVFDNKEITRGNYNLEKELIIIKIISECLNFLVQQETFNNNLKSQYLKLIIKFLEWGYINSHKNKLKKYFYKTYLKYYTYLVKNRYLLGEDIESNEVIMHYISFLLSFLEDKVSESDFGKKKDYNNKKIIEKITHLNKILRPRYVNYELYEHVMRVYDRLKQKINTNSFAFKMLIYFIKNFSDTINDDYVRLVRLLYDNRKIPCDGYFLVGANHSIDNSQKAEKLIPIAKKYINNKALDLFVEDFYIKYIDLLIDEENIVKSKELIIKLFKQKNLVMGNNVRMAYKLYYLLLKVLKKENKPYDTLIYLQNLRTLSKNFLGLISNDEVTKIFEYCRNKI